MLNSASTPHDTPELRKSRGAFFTPAPIAKFMADWAVRARTDRVLEPSAGDAEFLAHVVPALQRLGVRRPRVNGVELHEHSASIGVDRIDALGGVADILVSDFFATDAPNQYDAVIGNPPYIRFQDFTGAARARAQQAALRGGVRLSGLASAWAAFTIHGAMQLRRGGRLGYVLPAELLTANYAGPVRSFLFETFREIELIHFEERAFEEAETETLLLLADGYLDGPTDHAKIRNVRSATDLTNLPPGIDWTPADPSGKWSWSALGSEASDIYLSVMDSTNFTTLGEWGSVRLGAVTGNNRFFALTPERVADLGLVPSDIVRLSPPGSAHLRGLELSTRALNDLGAKGRRTVLFRPQGDPSPAAWQYIDAGHTAGVDSAYKCRVRKPWWRTPLSPPADLLLTYMNADTPRLVTNSAKAHHLNSVHGVYLDETNRELARRFLPLASLNTVTLLGAETVGRAYGGGVLKLEPGEAVVWPMPSPALIEAAAADLAAIRPQVAGRLRS